MSEFKQRIGASALTDSLLEYAFRPTPEELKEECSAHYLEELRLLKLFTVDYVLGQKGASDTAFRFVRFYFNAEIEHRCPSYGIDHGVIDSRFSTYADACNADALASRNPDEARAFWELGKMFSRLASDTDPWRPSALEVALHANFFASQCLRLAKLLSQYEVNTEDVRPTSE